jgi:hypothetical protein
MNFRQSLWAVLALSLLLAAPPAGATDSHTFARDEYAIIGGGLAPNRTVSLAAHGDGEGGSDNFHIWLMAEPGHRKLEALDGISSDNNLDTGPKAYFAQWSNDSRRVAVSFRSDRHVRQLNLYAVENRRARPIPGPTLFRQVTGGDIDPQWDMRPSMSELTWKGSDRFVLRERRRFITSEADFAGKLGAYGKLIDKLDNGRFWVEFSAEADCVVAGNRYRIVDIRVGKFGE